MYAKDLRSISSQRLLDEEQSSSSENKLDEEQSSSSENKLDLQLENKQIRMKKISAGLALQIVLFALSTTMLLLTASRYSDKQGQVPMCQCEDFMPQWSPALESVQHTGHTQRFDGSFATPNAFKGTPNSIIDDSWDKITDVTGGVISISEESLRKVNASLDYSVKLPLQIGGGYMASVEVLHQLHCLNMLRQATYENYYKDKAEPWTDSPQTLRYHLDHCIDNLRQKLMCDADAGILTYVWVQDHPMPFPDFSVQHRCRDFHALKRWVEANQVFTRDGYGVMRQPGSRELESPP